MEYRVEPYKEGIDLFPKSKVAEILQNISIIISTPKFSVPLDRGFGTRQEYIDMAANIAQPKIIIEIVDAIEEYEPRAEVKEVDFKVDGAKEGKIVPVVKVVIKDE